MITGLGQLEKTSNLFRKPKKKRHGELNSIRAPVTVVKGNIFHLQPAWVEVVVRYSGVCCPLGLRARQCRCGS